jgi:calcium/calmodulin-dependent protein kinase I
MEPSPLTYLRAQYRLGRTLGAGTYGIVREALGPSGKVAIKIILKKNVKGNEKMVYDELDMLQRLHHPHIVQFHDWFESKVRRPALLCSALLRFGMSR